MTEAAELILKNGAMYTVDASQPWCDAVAIAGGRFLAVGRFTELADLVGSRTAIVDLEGRFVMPGLHDMHTHPDLALGPKYADALTIGSEDPTPRDIERCVRQYAVQHPDAPWIYGQHFVHFTFRKEGLVADRHWLDGVMPDRPVAIHDRSWGCMLVNSTGLAAAGIDADTPDPRNGYIERDSFSGEPTGILVDGAYSLIYRVMPPPPDHALRAAYRDAVHYQSSRGVVASKYVHVCEHRLDALKALDDAGELTLRVEAAISWQDDIFPVRRRWQLLAGERHYYRSRRLNANAVKFHFDGTHESRSSYLATPWPGNDGWRGHLNLTPEHLADMVADMDRRGIRVIAHCTGDGASDLFLRAVAETRRRNGAGVRHQCAHSTLLLNENLSRFTELDVVAEFSPVGWQPTPFAYARRDAFGAERMARAYNFKGVLDAGGTAVMGTDWPVSHIDPWLGFEAMLTRSDPTGLHPGTFYGEPLSLEEAISVVTLNGARCMGLEASTGSIERGKSADLIVLDRNLFEVAPRIHATRVELTLLEGRPTWDAAGLLAAHGLTPTWRSPAPSL